MKILVYGAGVLGCNLARNLFRAGKNVTLLARGKWAEEIKKNGLRIKDKFSPCVSLSRIPVTTELKPEARNGELFRDRGHIFRRSYTNGLNHMHIVICYILEFPGNDRFLLNIHDAAE